MEIWNRSFIFEIAQDQTCRLTKAMVARVALVFFGVPCHRRVGSPTVTSSLVDFSCAWPTIAQLWGPEVGRFLLCGDRDGLQGASSRVCAVFWVVLSFAQSGTRLVYSNLEMSHLRFTYEALWSWHWLAFVWFPWLYPFQWNPTIYDLRSRV